MIRVRSHFGSRHVCRGGERYAPFCCSMLALAFFLCTALRADATDVTPVEKVVQMIRDLQTQVQDEGTKEATTYDKFACFCKSKTDEKTDAIETGETAVETITANLGTLTAKRDTLDGEIQTLNDEIAGYEEQLKTASGLRADEKKAFEGNLLDMTKAISALERAIETLKASKSLMSVKTEVRKSLLLADALDILPKPLKEHKVVMMLLSAHQPDVPVSDYDFHSGDIVSTLEGLLNTFRTSKVDLENDDASAQSSYDMSKQAKLDVLKTAQTSLAAAQKDRAKTTDKIAVANQDLTETNAILNDDRVYLKDLTSKCETKAKEWDQRSAMRADELAAITQALAVLESTVASKAGVTGAGGRGKAPVTTALTEDATSDDDEDDDDDVVFVQLKKARRASSPDSDEQSALRERLVALLKAQGAKLKSPALSTLAMKVQADPFVKIKGLIQELIERLLQEEADEADKKGWCDKEIAAAKKDRDYRLRDVQDLHGELESLNARHGTLSETKAKLEEEIATLNADLATQTSNRAEEKAENEQTVKDAEEGEAAVDQAIEILGHFYGAAAKATVLSQQPSVDDEAPDAGFEGAYTGSQSASTGILGMLDVIKGDFARTIKETTAAEDQAQRDFIEFERETKMSITTKTTAKEATDRELTEAADDLSTAGDELRTQQGLLDAAVETWEKLIPGCVADPGMSYEERVQRRNAEVQALKDAYCILSNEDAGCSGVFLQKRARLA